MASQFQHVFVGQVTEPATEARPRDGGEPVHHETGRLVESIDCIRFDSCAHQRRVHSVRGQRAHRDRCGGVELVILTITMGRALPVQAPRAAAG